MIDPAFGHWFAGFTDGEGCFLINKMRKSFSCQFTIQLRIDDHEILKEINRQLLIGSVNYAYGTTGSNRNSKPRACYHVSSKEGCVKLREVFRAYPLRAKKSKDFEIWSEALDFWVTYKRGDDWAPMESARERLRACREYKEVA